MTPLDKFKLIQTIHQQQPHTIVAMIGDSINDILAIQESDVGITIESNSNSSEELKQISHIILMKNKLNGLYECIKEGRRMIENLKKSICFYLICKLTLILLYIASFFNNSSSLPLQPLHIIILECFMDIGK